MGKGKSPLRGGGTAKTQVVTQSGIVADLTGTPLVYGAKDSSLSARQRVAMEAQEKKRSTAKIEYAMSVDANGNVINEVKGGRSSCRIPISMEPDGSVFTHNHPRSKGDEGMLGGTFSNADLQNFASYGAKTYRASAAEGTYSITKGVDFNANAFKAFVVRTDRQIMGECNTRIGKYVTDYKARKISYNDYLSGRRMEFNKAMVELHNAYLAGQKSYGYTYTLEER